MDLSPSAPERIGRVNGNAVPRDVDLRPRGLELAEHRGEMPRHDVGDGGRAAGDRGRHQQRGRLDAVGDQSMRGAAELIDTPDVDHRRSQSFDLRPQRKEEIAQVDDLRLDGRAANDGDAPGEHRGAEDVGRAGHGRTTGAGKVDGRAGQPPRRGHHVAVPYLQIGAEGGQALQVQIDRPVADVAAAGQGNDGPAAPGQQRPQYAEAGPHPPHKSLRRRTGVGSAVSNAMPPSTWATAIPRCRSTRACVCTSASCGTFCSCTGSEAKMAAAMIGSAAFFAPLQRTSPCKAVPPVISKWDIG